MFVREELTLDVGIVAASVRLRSLVNDGSLHSASEGAYDNGLVTLMRVGPFGDLPGVSKLVRVRFMDLVINEDCAMLALRWEATGPGGRLFPALDADIRLEDVGGQQTRLILTGAYRPPLAAVGAGLDRAILGRVASATMRSLVGRLAAAIDPSGASQWAESYDSGPIPRPIIEAED